MSERLTPRLLVCGFGPFPGFPDNPAMLVVRRLEAQAWAPADAPIAYRETPTTWSGAVATVGDAMRETGAGGVLLLGVAPGADRFRVEMRAANIARTDLPDAVGRLFARANISTLGPATARATAPVEPMVAALREAGLPAYASSDAGDYLCNYTFYRVLTELASEPRAPLAAFLHLPVVQDGLGLEELERGVQAVASAFARTLAFGHLAEPLTA